MITWNENIIRLSGLLQDLSVKDACQKEIGGESGFSLWREWSRRMRSRDRHIYFVGNGASASMASHFAADLAKSAGVRTQVFTDPSLITATANDISYEDVFAVPLRWWMKQGDMLVAISTSGNSPNIRRGAETARKLGAAIVTLSAMKGENALRKLGDLNFYVPAETYGLAETCHAAILHFWVDQVV